MIATDFLIHGGLLAWLYTKPFPFLLAAGDAFERIPLGYLSFLFLAILLYWIFVKFQPTSPKEGFLIGLILGLLIWISFGLGLYSISIAPLILMMGWVIGQSFSMGIGGYFIKYYDINGGKAWKVLILYAIVIILITIGLQIIGWAPPMELH